MSVRDREDALVARLHALAPHLDGEPAAEFRAATRARLVAMAAVRAPAPEPVSGFRRLLAVRASDATPSRFRTRLTAGLAGAALTVTALATLVAVADEAGPGDVLYPLKRGTEQAQLAVAGDSRGQTLLDFAGTRLDELESLVDTPTALPAAGAAGPAGTTVLAAGGDPALVLETLRTMDEQTTEGTVWLTDSAVETRSSAPLEVLSEWAAEQHAGLAAVAPLVPDAAAGAAADSLALLTDISTRVEGLDSAVDCPPGPAVNGDDELGPVPGLCVPPPVTTAEPLPPTGTVPAPAPQAPGQTFAPAPPVAGTTPEDTGTTPEDTGTTPEDTGTTPEDLPATLVPPVPPPPSSGGGLAPSLTPPPLPPSGGGGVLDVPDVPVPFCLPPLATLGNC